MVLPQILGRDEEISIDCLPVWSENSCGLICGDEVYAAKVSLGAIHASAVAPPQSSQRKLHEKGNMRRVMSLGESVYPGSKWA